MSDLAFQKTRRAFIGMRLLAIPFWGVFALLSLIIYKDLQVSTLQITVAIALKPVSCILSPYWSHAIYERADRLISNIFWGNLIKYTPFLLMPFVKNSWFVVLSMGFFWVLKRGVTPAWMEVLKLHIPKQIRSKLFAFGSSIDYIGGALMPFVFGMILDAYADSWRWLLFGTALVAIASSWLIYQVPSFCPPDLSGKKKQRPQLFTPAKRAINLLKTNREFLVFQGGFMLGGAGLMLIQPAQHLFMCKTLSLSYMQMSLAIALYKGVGYALTSPMWARCFDRLNIYKFCSVVTLLAAIYPLLMLMSQAHLVYFYIAFFLYGVMQAGSELSWHMSGPIFSGEQDSSVYTATNVLAVGVRGAFVPFLGGALLAGFGSHAVMLLGGLLSLSATVVLWRAKGFDRLKVEA